MVDSRTLRAGGTFLAGFVAIIIAGKVIFPALTDALAVPNGMYLQGIIGGLLSALLGIGLVLVYRSNRIINFAQGSLGAVAATLAAQLHQIYRVPYIISIITGLLAGLALSLLTEFAVIRRFSKAPRLILTVATIGVFQILSLIELLPKALNRTSLAACDVALRESVHRLPLHVRTRDGSLPTTSSCSSSRRSSSSGSRTSSDARGTASRARAAAENGERARLLGCRVKRVSLVVWGVAGLAVGGHRHPPRADLRLHISARSRVRICSSARWPRRCSRGWRAFR